MDKGDPRTRLCLGCGYDLHLLSEGKCPECGRRFDPAQPLTVQNRLREMSFDRQAIAIFGSGAVCALAGVIPGFVGPLLISPDSNQGPLLGLCMTGPAGFVAGAVVGAWAVTRRIATERAVTRRILIAAIVYFCAVALLVLLGAGAMSSRT